MKRISSSFNVNTIEDARSYAIVFTEAWARVDNTGSITARLSGYAYEINGETRTPMKNATIIYGYILTDPDTYVDTHTDSNGYFSADEDWFDGDTIDGYAKNSSNIFAAIIVNGNAVCAEYVTMAKDGLTGERGKVGRFFYYAGVWNATNEKDSFVVNDAQAPYFSKAGSSSDSFYVFDYEVNGSYTMKQMRLVQSNWNQSPWKVMTSNFKYLITEAIFAEFAKFGSFIISGDWMISTNGTINGTVFNAGTLYYGAAAYTRFDPKYPKDSVNTTHTVNGVTWNGYNFVPNYAVDGLTGNTYQHNAYISGEIETTGWGMIDLNDGNHGNCDDGFVISSGGTYFFDSNGHPNYIYGGSGSNGRVNISIDTDNIQDGTIITFIDKNIAINSSYFVPLPYANDGHTKYASVNPHTNMFDVIPTTSSYDSMTSNCAQISIRKGSSSSSDIYFRGNTCIVYSPRSGREVVFVDSAKDLFMCGGSIQLIKTGGTLKTVYNSSTLLYTKYETNKMPPGLYGVVAYKSASQGYMSCNGFSAVFYYGRQIRNEYWDFDTSQL